MPRSERGSVGSATVEFALVLPLVLVVVLALVQVGLLVRDRLLVEAAGGARPRASVETTRVGERGSPVTVRFLYAESFRVPLVGWLVGSGVTLTAEAAARQEFG